MFNMFGRTGASQKGGPTGGQRMSDSNAKLELDAKL